jgi:DNA-binding NarL/FixJ family response regulator
MNNQIKILIADDNTAHRVLIKRSIQKCLNDAQIVEAGSLSAAKSILTAATAKERFTLAVFDLNLGDGRGTELVRLLRCSKSSADSVAIVLSTSTSLEDAKDCYQAGANCYLHKEDNPQVFSQVLTSALQFFLKSRITI